MRVICEILPLLWFCIYMTMSAVRWEEEEGRVSRWWWCRGNETDGRCSLRHWCGEMMQLMECLYPLPDNNLNTSNIKSLPTFYLKIMLCITDSIWNPISSDYFVLTQLHPSGIRNLSLTRSLPLSPSTQSSIRPWDCWHSLSGASWSEHDLHEDPGSLHTRIVTLW